MRAAGRSEPLANARRLLEHLIERDGAWLLAHGDDVLDSADQARYVSGIERLARGEPLAYVIGSAWFYGRRFEVNADVLVPRPETEELAERAIRFVREAGRAVAVVRVLDVGTGSGALALTLAAELPDARVVALDVSEAALFVARRNARSLALDDRVEFVLDGTFGSRFAREESSRFDCIVANLPYVPSADLAPAPDPTSFEPRLALDGGADGLDLYRGLLHVAPSLLARGGAVFLEAAPGTVEPLAALARAAFGEGVEVAIVADLAGLDRIVSIRT